jgi:hypothetical protein
LDNILSHHQIFGVIQERQGIARKLTIEALVILALIVTLSQDLGVPVPNAIKTAEEMARQQGRFRSTQGLTIEIDLAGFRAQLLDELERAVEIAPTPKRGRPPSNKTGRLD